MKKILITGAVHGLGKHLTNLLLSKGHFIYGTTRNLKEARQERNLKLFYLDYCDESSITDLINYFNVLGDPLDAIIHNAGIAYLDPIEIMAEEEYRHLFEVNFFGPVALTTKLLPILKKSKESHLIFISSIVSIDCWPHLGAYSASKRALESVAFEWATILKQWNILVSVVQPNPLPTNMKIMRSKNANKSPYPELKNRALKWEKIEETVELLNQILEDKAPKFQYQTGKHSRDTASKFLKEGAYQRSLEAYQNQYIELISSNQN